MARRHRRPGGPSTSRCSRPTRTAPRQWWTGPGRPSRISARPGSGSRPRGGRAMTTAAPETRRRPATGEEQQPADVLVVFGITGDLARVMTFRSLYRLERRGLLDCPIVGVAVDDWTIDDLRERAKTSIEGTGEELDPAIFDRLANRLSYVEGDF